QRSLSDPGSKMIDSDWDKVAGRFDEFFSFTESDAEMRGLLAKLEVGRHVSGDPEKLSFSLNAALHYQRVVQNIDNYAGWQMPFNESAYQYEDSIELSSADTAVLYYKITYLAPGLGFSTTIGSVNRSFARMTFLGQVIFAEDFDDHIRRFKSSPGKGTGQGFSASGLWHFVPISGSKPLFVEFSATFSTLSIQGSQTQTWYGDDPASVGDDTGQSVSGIPHDFHSTQYSIGLSIGKEI
ncbi:MAG: hypothetical protein P1R58_10890, partial [bacterium]|nr:hypothetical protein [bacterium]